ncbi:MAG: hypothetical protein ABFE16_09600 [Armatimonadia bacterium]
MKNGPMRLAFPLLLALLCSYALAQPAAGGTTTAPTLPPPPGGTQTPGTGAPTTPPPATQAPAAGTTGAPVQGTTTAPTATGPVQPPPQEVTAAKPATPEQLWRDTWVLWKTTQLGINPDQAKRIAEPLTGLQTVVTQGKKLRADTWKTAGTTVQAVIDQWMMGREPAPQLTAVADDAAKKAQGQTAQEQTLTQSTAATVVQNLTPDQRNLVESADEATAREQARANYDGASTFGEYLTGVIASHRYLMPDEYVAIRALEADRAAAKLADSRSPQFTQVKQGILGILDQAANMNDQQLAAALPQFPAQIQQYLGITSDVPQRAITYEAFQRWIKDSRTPEYLNLYGTPEARPLPPEEEPTLDDLQKALATAQWVSMFNSLRLDPQQLAQASQICTAARQEVDKRKAAKEQIMTTAVKQLTNVLPVLVTGKPVNDQWRAVLWQLEAAIQKEDDSLNEAMVPLVEALRHVFYPDQAAMVDFRVPPGVSGGQSTPQERATTKKQDAAMVKEAMDLISFLRPLDQPTFLRLRPARVDQFLSRYMRQGSRQYDAASQRISEIIQSSRGIQGNQWQDSLPDVALECLRAAGQLQSDRGGWRPSNRGLDWYGVRDLLVSPEAGEAAKKMLTVRTQGAGG